MKNRRIILSVTAISISLIIVVSIISFGALSSTNLALQNSGYDDDNDMNTMGGPTLLSVASLVQQGSYIKGDANAPLTLIEFADFQCPFCGRFAKETAPVIDKEYIETGKVSMVFKHFPLRGSDSISASIASQCAGDQGKFWEYHDILYGNQGMENSGRASKDRLKAFASDIGLHRTSFDACLESNRYSQLVQNDLQFAKDLGLTGTPTFVTAYSDGSEPQAFAGALPADAFRKILNDKLADVEN